MGAALLLGLTLALLFALLPFSVFLPAYAFPAREEGETRLHFLDVGQGDCTAVEFADGEVLVVDAGDGSFFHNNKILRYIKGLRPTRLSLLLTHADADHYGGFRALLRSFDVETLYLPLYPAEGEEYSALLEQAEREGCAAEHITRYGKIEGEGGYAVCISPRSEEETDDNDASTVLYLNFGGVTALLCGDISSAREKLLVREYALTPDIFDSGDCTVRAEEIDILKAPHHGSSDASSQEFLELLRPENYIVSCGRDNGYRFPAGEALARFRAASPDGNIYRTDELGDIVVRIANGSYTISAREEL